MRHKSSGVGREGGREIEIRTGREKDVTPEWEDGDNDDEWMHGKPFPPGYMYVQAVEEAMFRGVFLTPSKSEERDIPPSPKP